MTSEHVAGVAAMYNADLRAAAVADVENGQPLEHVRWMCGRIQELVRDRDYDKADRWLGFVQGVLYAHGCYSIPTMRTHNRSPEEQKAARSRTANELKMALGAAVWPGPDVSVEGHGDEVIVVTTRQPDGACRKHWLQVREVKEVPPPISG